MLCEICHKNEATIHIQEIIGGQKKSMHLCSSCAAAKQQGEGLGFDPFNLAGLLYKLSGNTTGAEYLFKVQPYRTVNGTEVAGIESAVVPGVAIPAAPTGLKVENKDKC